MHQWTDQALLSGLSATTSWKPLKVNLIVFLMATSIVCQSPKRHSTALHLANLSNVSVSSTPPIVSSCIFQLSEEDVARKRNGVVEELKELPKIGGMNKQKLQLQNLVTEVNLVHLCLTKQRAKLNLINQKQLPPKQKI